MTDAPPSYIKHKWGLVRQHENAILFIGGFLFDAATLIRIDAWFDLAIQLVYLLAVTGLLYLQSREQQGVWHPHSRLEKLWSYADEALYFFYGGLFSNYVVLYFKSTTGARTLAFFILLAALLFINELPTVRRLGNRLRMGFYSFCWAGFLIYFVPIVVGRMNDFTFVVSLALATYLTWKVAALLVPKGDHFKAAHRRLFVPAGIVLALITLLYFFRLIPPVPLSVQYQGVFHDVDKREDGYHLKSEKPAFYWFWRKDSRPFRYVEGEPVYYFVRIFAPSRFHHDAQIRWEKKDSVTGDYVTRDVIPLQIFGGRSDGFRGYVAKTNFEEGRWRVSAETADGRTIGMIRFNVLKVNEGDRRGWQEELM